MKIRKKSLSYVIPIITIVSVLITATPCYAAETQYLDGYKGIIFFTSHSALQRVYNSLQHNAVQSVLHDTEGTHRCRKGP